MQCLEKNFLTLDRTLDARSALRNAERSALAAETLRTAGSLRLHLRGESMLPVLWPGDLADIQSCTLEDVEPGDIVLALRDGRFFLHRLLVRQSNGFLLRGDSMPGSDPAFSPDALIGKLVCCQGQGHVRQLGASSWSRAIGYILCHWGIARRVALKFHRIRQQQSSHRSLHRNGIPEVGAIDLGAS